MDVAHVDSGSEAELALDHIIGHTLFFTCSLLDKDFEIKIEQISLEGLYGQEKEGNVITGDAHSISPR